jgi:hypothetical protein
MIKLKAAGSGLFFTALIYLFAGCQPDEAPVPQEQEVLFEVYSINFVWGKQHGGFIIDKNGSIKVFTNPAKWNFPTADNELSAEEMAENLNNSALSSTSIPMREVQEYASKIYTVDPNKLSKRVSEGADMGARVMLMYRYNPSSKTYQQVILSETGDWNAENSDKHAKQIKEWLQGIGKSL